MTGPADVRTLTLDRSQLLTLLADQTREYAFIFLDLQGRVVDWTVGAEKLFGYSSENAVGQEFARIFSSEDQRRGIVELEMAIANADAISEDDRWHVRADGSRFWCTGSLTALRAKDGSLLGFAKILRNRTNLKEQLELLQRQALLARDDTRRQDVVIAKVSHELRNLLAALTHGVEMIGSAKADSARRDSLSHMLQEQIQLVRRLADDLLDVERMKEGKVSLYKAPLVLQDVLRQAIESLRPRLPEKRLQLELFEATTPLRVHADATRLYQVFVNLIDNAIKYTSPGGRIWVKATIEDPDAVVHVEDTGIGIPSDMLSRIFDLFTQVDGAASHKGLGIGLALVRDLVLMHGGSVQARSEGAGKGSVFTVRLPLLSAAS